MADAKFSGTGVILLNGSVGNTTYARNKYGYYAKAKKGAPASTPFLVAQQNIYMSNNTAWQALNDRTRNEWIALQRLRKDSIGDSHAISGYDLFMGINADRARASLPPLLVAPTSNTAYRITSVSISSLSGPVLLANATINNPAGVIFIYVTPSLSAGRMSNNQIYRWLLFNNGSFAGLDITASYSARISAPISGLKVFIKATAFNPVSGIMSIPRYGSVIVS